MSDIRRVIPTQNLAVYKPDVPVEQDSARDETTRENLDETASTNGLDETAS